MSDIPADIEAVAKSLFAGYATTEKVARAILAERERCAKIAEAQIASPPPSLTSSDLYHWQQELGAEFAAAIRSPSDPAALALLPGEGS